MSTPVYIVGVNGIRVKVTGSGELVTAPLEYSDPVFVELAEPNTAYNFFIPKTMKQLVITGFSLKADRDVSPTVDATVIIYEASSVDSTTVDKTIFQDGMIRGERIGYSNTNILVNSGVWVNAKTTDDDILVTIFGYYIDKLE